MGETKRPLAFFVGSATAANMQVLIDNIGFMLSNQFELDLITTTPQAFEFDTRDTFRVIGSEYSATIQGGARALYDYLQNNNPAVIVQLTAPPTHGTIVTTVAKRFDVPSVYRYSGDLFGAYQLLSPKNQITAYLRNNIFGQLPIRLANRHIVLGPAGRQSLLQHGVDNTNIVELPPSVNPDRINDSSPLPTVNIPDSRPIVLFVGRIHPLKGSETMAEQIPKIIDRRDDIQFVFVGDDHGFTVPPKYRENITLIGEVPPDEVSRYFHLADVLVHPSLTDGLPRVVLESLTAGTPVIARDVGEISSVTENTFETDQEFANMVCRFEDLPLDDATSFTRYELKPKYVSFFDQF